MYWEDISTKLKNGTISETTAILRFSHDRCASEASILNLPIKLHRDSPLNTSFSVWANLFDRLLEIYHSHERYAPNFVDMYISPYSNARMRFKAVDLLSNYFSLRPESLHERIDIAIEIAQLCEPNAYRDADVKMYTSLVSKVDKLKGYHPYDVYKETLSLHYVGITRARKICYIPTATHRHEYDRGIGDYRLVPAKPSSFLERNGVRRLRLEVEWITQ